MKWGIQGVAQDKVRQYSYNADVGRMHQVSNKWGISTYTPKLYFIRLGQAI